MAPLILSKLQNLFYIGIDRSANLYEIRHVLLLNIMVVFVSSYALVMGLLHYRHAAFVLWICAGYAMIVWLVYLLHYYRLYLVARVYFGIISWGIQFSLSLFTGRASNMQWYLLFSLVLVFFLFSHREKLFMGGFLLLFIMSYLAIELLPNLESYQLATIQEAQAISYAINLGIILFALFFSFFSFYVVNNTEKSFIAEQSLSERLLLNVLPPSIVKKLRTDPGLIAEKSSSGSVLFADIVGFTALTAAKTPEETVAMLNDIFSEFDDLIENTGLEKIKTIGDAVMVAGGIPEYRENHLELIAGLALAMQQKIRDHYTEKYGIDLRVGIDTGEIVAGIIGRKKFLYDLWGHTVNTASRMESNGVPGKIQVTENVYTLLNGDYVFECRGKVECKGLGEVTTYFLNGRRDERMGQVWM